MIRQIGTAMSTEEIVRKLLEDAQQGTLPFVEEAAPIIDLDTATEWEIDEAIEAAARVTDANHPEFTPPSPRRSPGSKQKRIPR
jgi:hypothetical protein